MGVDECFLCLTEAFFFAGGGDEEVITRQQKTERVKELTQGLQEAEAVFLTDYRGLTVKEISSLRRDLQVKECRYMVVKNTLTKLAAKEVGIEDINEYLEGPVAIAFSNGDPVETAKVLLSKVKEFKSLSIKAGVLDGKLMNTEQVKQLGSIPPKDVLLATVCGTFNAPITGLVVALKGNINNLVYALEAVKKQKEAS